MDAKHIERYYSSTDISRKHVPKLNARVSILTSIKKDETRYLSNNVTYSNAKKTTWKAWDSIEGTSATINFYIEFDYIAPEDGQYRIELIHGSTRSEDKQGEIYISIDGEETDISSKATIHKTIMNRTVHQLNLKKGKHHIRYELGDMMVFLGAICRHMKLYLGDTQNNHELTFLSGNYKTTGGATVDEFSFNLLYEEWFREEIPDDRTQLIYNPSGYIFDYRDEVNLYVEPNTEPENGDNKFETQYGTNGTYKDLIQIFGGYISSISTDVDMKTITINCASRLKDLEIRHTLHEIGIGVEGADFDGYSNDSLLAVTSYMEAIKELCGTSEVPLIINSPEYDEAAKKSSEMFMLRFNKNGNSKISEADLNDVQCDYDASTTGPVLRNNPDTSFQSVILYDSGSETGRYDVDITNMPTFQIVTAMDEGVEEHKMVDQTDTTTEVVITGGVTQEVIDFAKNCTTSTNPVQIIIDCATRIYNTLTYNGYGGFLQTPAVCLQRKTGNCCDGSRLLATCCAVHHVTIQYVHVSGHVYNRYNGVDYDWLKFWMGSSAVGLNATPGRTLLKVTTYPTLPF